MSCLFLVESVTSHLCSQGKSLSLICGALTWLSDHDKSVRDQLESLLKSSNETASNGESNSSDPFDWINQQAEEVASRQKRAETKLKLDLLDKYQMKLSKMKQGSKQRVSLGVVIQSYQEDY